jgi:hypothetical protein
VVCPLDFSTSGLERDYCEGILVPRLLFRFGWRRTFLILGFTALIWIAPSGADKIAGAHHQPRILRLIVAGIGIVLFLMILIIYKLNL